MLSKESNAYTILFSVIMVVVVGTVLALVAQYTKPFQDENIKKEKMQSILSSVGVDVSRSEAPEAFAKYIQSGFVYKNDGSFVDSISTKLEESQAFKLDLAVELKKPLEEQSFPLFICNKDGKKLYIIPMRGKGLWGPVWGYVAIESDLNTVAGASFGHKGETPGLGAEIEKPIFQDQFPGKKLTDASGVLKGVTVVKKGKAVPGEEEYSVDGISGGTITSNGVKAMLEKYFAAFKEFAKKSGMNAGSQELSAK